MTQMTSDALIRPTPEQLAERRAAIEEGLKYGAHMGFSSKLIMPLFAEIDALVKQYADMKVYATQLESRIVAAVGEPGLRYTSSGELVLESPLDTDWPDLVELYLDACAALKVEPTITNDGRCTVCGVQLGSETSMHVCETCGAS